MTQLVWFRTDLRTHDNPALWAACQNSDGGVLSVVYITEKQWQHHGLGPRKIQLIKNAILRLKESLERLNIPLLIIKADTFTECIHSLQRTMTQLDVQHLYFNAEYEVNEKRRDNEVKHWCRHQRISISQFHDQCIVKPGTVLTQQGQAFKVFSPFKRAWINLADNRIATPLAQPLKRPLTVQKALFKLCSAQANNALLNYLEDPLWPISEDEAQNRLNEFVAERAEAYQQLRDLPAANATSRLSTYLSLGLLSPLQCLQTAMLHNQGLLISGNQGFNSWVNELIWRDFYRHLLVAFPKLCMHKAFKEETEQVQWRNSNDDFQAWCEGRTGYPLVDAAQRQLHSEGWMHNRLRMISAMFLTKHLLIDWRKGEAFFNHHLVDADLASNNGGWQWSASTGADGVPYFRIFNPTTQSQRFDSNGEFLTRFIPELGTLPAAARHNPSAQQRLICNYPEPIVEHKFARQRALNAFKLLTL